MRGNIVDFNFKVSAEFRKEFKRAAVDMDLTNKQLLQYIFYTWQRNGDCQPECVSPDDAMVQGG